MSDRSTATNDRFRQLRMLTHVSRALTAARTSETAERLIVDKAAELLGSDRAILLLDDDDGELLVHATYGIDEGLAATIREPNGLELHARLERVLEGPAKPCYFGVPLVIRDQVSGVLAVSCSSPRADPDGDEWLLSALADQAAVALAQVGTKELRQTEDLFRLLVDTLDEYAIIALDPEGRVTTWNLGAERITGYCASDIVGRRFHCLYAANESTLDADHVLAVARDRHRYASEVVLSRKDGSRFWAEMLLVPLRNGENDLRGYAHVIRDVTARRAGEERDRETLRSQAALVESERERHREEAANRMKDEFLATVSHELRTPLNAILGWARVLQETNIGADLWPKGLQTIERNAKAQANLIEDILDVSRIIFGQMRIRMAPVSIRAVLESALETVRPSAEAKGIILYAELKEWLGSLVGDENRLQQVVWNLLSNAVKFTPRGGRVAVRAERLGGEVTISVCDTGKGISPAFLPFAFERFRQDDATTTRSHTGLGLGLAIVRHLVELHGGTVHAQSAGEGRGTTMVVHLPIRAVVTSDAQEAITVVARGSPPRLDPQGRLRGLHVVVVDDTVDARELIATMLERAGATTSMAGSVREAMVVLENVDADVLVSDIGMPVEDGYSLIARIRSVLDNDALRSMPALALTACARNEDRERAFSAGFQTYVAKPIEPVQLVAEVARLAHRG